MRGKCVGVLESRFGEHLADLLRRQGAQVLHAPALAELPDVDDQQIAELVDSLIERPAGLYLFQTGVGTRALFEALDRLGRTPDFVALLAQARVGVRGPKPVAVLRGRRIRMDYEAASPYTTAELLAAIGAFDMHDQRVVVQRYGDSNTGLTQALATRGATVVEVAAYRWAMPEDVAPMEGLLEALGQGQLNAVVFTSASQLHNLLELARRKGMAEALPSMLNATLVASIGPVCSEALRNAGIVVALEASPPKLGPLVQSLAAALS